MNRKIITNNNYIYYFTNLKEKYYQRSRFWEQENYEKHGWDLWSALISVVGHEA